MEIQYDIDSKYRIRKRTLKHRSQPKTQPKRSPDYSASQDKEIIIKPLKIEYINIHKEYI
jgi:predicted nuclease of restriction endonuclease-like (RecB) superfamily